MPHAPAAPPAIPLFVATSDPPFGAPASATPFGTAMLAQAPAQYISDALGRNPDQGRRGQPTEYQIQEHYFAARSNHSLSEAGEKYGEFLNTYKQACHASLLSSAFFSLPMWQRSPKDMLLRCMAEPAGHSSRPLCLRIFNALALPARRVPRTRTPDAVLDVLILATGLICQVGDAEELVLFSTARKWHGQRLRMH